MLTISGTFKDLHDNDIQVVIEKQSTQTQTYTINGEDGIYFAGDNPVTITQDVENEFQHILSKQCTINLICEDYVGDLFFADNARDVSVYITKYIDTGHSYRRYRVFEGYLEPVTFSQGFAHKLETFTLTANDYLGTLEYLNYKDVTLSTYDQIKQASANTSFRDILLSIFPVTHIWYDQSKGVNSNSLSSVFADLGIFDTYLLGECYDDTWTQRDVLNEIMQYLNLHIVQVAGEFYVFDWETLSGSNITQANWYDIRTGQTKARESIFIELTKENYGSDDTNVTVADVFNQIQVKDELEPLETIVESPLDSNSLRSYYHGAVHYMTEYVTLGSGLAAFNGFKNMVQGNATDFGSARQIEWYVQPMYNINWVLNTSTGDINNQVEYDEDGVAIYPYKLPEYAKNNDITSLIMKCGSVEKKSATDNSPIAKVDMTPYLFISINGNTKDPSTSQNSWDQPYPDNSSILYDRSPIMEYVSMQSGGTYSPPDEATTNYIVFSGKMLLMPRVYESDHWANVYHQKASGLPWTKSHFVYDTYYDNVEEDYVSVPGEGYYEAVPSTNNEDGRYYTRKFYKNKYWWQDLEQDEPYSPITDFRSDDYDEGCVRGTKVNLQMWTDDKGEQSLNYKYSGTGDKNKAQIDKISKLPILECELIIGNKRCVEINMGEWGNSEFIWIDASSGYPQSYIDENGVEQNYLKTTFSLGINPKTENDGDYIIGTEFDLQNTVKIQMMLGDAEGTAIPIRNSDALSGKVTFRILGPICLTYDEITRRHPSFWRHTKWTTTSKSVLSKCESIMIKDFEAKIYSDGTIEDPGDNDLIYVSDEIDRYLSKADEVSFKFVTQLTKLECIQKGISQSVNQNAVVNMNTRIPITSLYNAITGETAKPEEHYVDQYFRIFSTPRVVTETTLQDDTTDIDFSYNYYMEGTDRVSYVLGISQDLKLCKSTVKMKEF